MEKYNLTTGQMLDSIQDGQIAECDNGYVVERNGNIYWGTDVNDILRMNKFHLELKWVLTDFFENRISNCCGSPIKYGDKNYKDGKPTQYGHSEYDRSRGEL